jgi:ABC-type phosphate transport system substrate-binding protein
MTIVKLLTLLSLLLSALAVHADIVVVINSHSTIDHLTREQVADIFLGRVGTFPNGLKSTPVEQLESQPGYLAFHALVTGKNAIQLKAYWSKMVFSGQALPPITVSQDKLLQVLAASPHAITYLDRRLVDGSVKIVFPNEEGKK